MCAYARHLHEIQNEASEKQQQTFYVHFSLLESHSPVLAAMFHNNLCVCVCIGGVRL